MPAHIDEAGRVIRLQFIRLNQISLSRALRNMKFRCDYIEAQGKMVTIFIFKIGKLISNGG